MIGAAVFYLGMPATLLLHVAAHGLSAWLLGVHVEPVAFAFLSERIIAPGETASSAWEQCAVAASGVAVSAAIAAAAVTDVCLRPINAAWNFARLELARLTAMLLLLFYPAASLILDVGDFAVLRRQLDLVHPYLGEGVLMAWLAAAALVGWQWHRGNWRRRFMELTTSWFHTVTEAKHAVQDDPEDGASWGALGRAYLASGRIEPAHHALLRACDLLPTDPEARLLLGLVLLKKDRPEEASEQLRAAGHILEERRVPSKQDDRLLYETMLALTHARMSLGDSEGAVLTTEAALGRRERDARALLLHSDALVFAGRVQDAKAWLKQARIGAEGMLDREIRRRLATLARQTR